LNGLAFPSNANNRKTEVFEDCMILRQHRSKRLFSFLIICEWAAKMGLEKPWFSKSIFSSKYTGGALGWKTALNLLLYPPVPN